VTWPVSYKAIVHVIDMRRLCTVSPYYRDRERPADADVAMAIHAKWEYIAQQHTTFNMTADQAKTLLLPRGGAAIWSTVYYERRYLETCCDRYNVSTVCTSFLEYPEYGTLGMDADGC